MAGNDPYGILDDLTFLDDYDADTIEEALLAAERAESTTPEGERNRCPVCNTVRIRGVPPRVSNKHAKEGDFKCQNNHHFDTPITPNTTDGQLATDGGTGSQ